VKATCMDVSRDSRCWYLTMVVSKNPPRHPLCCDLRCACLGETASIGPSESATQLHLPCMHVSESTPSSCYLCIHLAHNQIDHDLSYDYDVRQTDSPKHALSVTTPLYDDNPVGPPAIEPPDLGRGSRTINRYCRKNNNNQNFVDCTKSLVVYSRNNLGQVE
jgi:hypothetical protein